MSEQVRDVLIPDRDHQLPTWKFPVSPTRVMNDPKTVVDEVFSTFRARGGRFYGENITETQHALQCATFAERDGESETMVAACLLHDYGHLLHDLGEDIASQGVDTRHESVGANRLLRYFKEEIVEPVRLHVAAKRYLCWKDKDYLENLSAASMQSLGLQGGVMTDDEGRAFESHPYFEPALRLRHYDDLGKVPDMATPDFEHFRSIIEKFVRV